MRENFYFSYADNWSVIEVLYYEILPYCFELELVGGYIERKIPYLVA